MTAFKVCKHNVLAQTKTEAAMTILSSFALHPCSPRSCLSPPPN